MQFTLVETRLGLLNSTTRLPFRYGKACLTRCPQVVLRATIDVGGRRQAGYSGDCLPPGWFDKSPTKDYRLQIAEMLDVIALSERVFLDHGKQPQDFFSVWRQASHEVHQQAQERQYESLLASFGVSLVERALMDALCRAHGCGFATAVRENLFRLVPGEIHPELASVELAQALPAVPLTSVYVRHTTGLADPLTTADIPPEERLNDGFPQSLEEYLQQDGVRYLKIKVCGDLNHDIQRLSTIKDLLQRQWGDSYQLTLDGNEQYASADQFQALIEALLSRPELDGLLRNTIAIEQPLERSIALEEAHTEGIRQLSKSKPVIIDESDGTIDAYSRAIELGYRGISSKNCKGPTKSLLNAALTWWHNQSHEAPHYLMTGEDLCSVGVVPVQADLCLAATIGLDHVERNGHHYQRGLSYLPEPEQQAALETHADFYAAQHGIVSPRIVDGRFEIGSFHGVGFGFGVEPDMDARQSADEWDFDSLGV